MSTLESAPQRAHPLTEVKKQHQRECCEKLSEWGYVFTGFDGKSGAMMMHPQAGVIRVHNTPTNKAGQMKTVLRQAKQQLGRVGITVVLPWHNQPKKESGEMAAAETATRTRTELSAGEARRVIHAKIVAGEFGEEFTTASVWEKMNEEYVLPFYSGDINRRGAVFVSQTLNQGVGRFLDVDASKKPRVFRRHRLKVTEPKTVVPPVVDAALDAAGVETDTEEHAQHKEHVREVIRQETLPPAPTPQQAETPPTPEPDTETPEAPAPEPPQPGAGLPVELIQQLRDAFVGDLEVENELLREGMQHMATILRDAADECAGILEAISAGQQIATARRRREPSDLELKRIGKLGDVWEFGEEWHYSRLAKKAELDPALANNALAAAVRHGWSFSTLEHEDWHIEKISRGVYKRVAD